MRRDRMVAACIGFGAGFGGVAAVLAYHFFIAAPASVSTLGYNPPYAGADPLLVPAIVGIAFLLTIAVLAAAYLLVRCEEEDGPSAQNEVVKND